MKVRVNGQIIDNVTEISVDMGNVESIYDICGMFDLCPDCKEIGVPCGKRYKFCTIKGYKGSLCIVTPDADYFFDADTEYELL